VVVSALNEERYLARCLDAVLGQDYDPELVRVWFVDGGSTDRTVRLAEERAADPRLMVMADGRRRNLPEALNLALERSNAELVAKIDAHGYPARDFLSRAVASFREQPADVACVGGRPDQHGETESGEAVALARTSRFGVGGSVYAGRLSRDFVDTVQCGVYRRAALEQVGGFDPAMPFGEDEDLNWRLRRAGYRIALDTSIRFHYVTRPSLRAAFRQYYRYGRARVRVVAAHPRFLRPRHTVPAVFLLALVGLAAASVVSAPARLAFLALLVAYVAVAAGWALAATRGRPGFLTLRVAACFAALHVGYGLGTLRGLLDLPSGRWRRSSARGRSSSGTANRR
jgi:succinoglycan biosynthesis protein ExoA